MPYERMPGIVGLIYVPPKADNESKKYPCPDCFVCQWCGNSRCAPVVDRAIMEREKIIPRQHVVRLENRKKTLETKDPPPHFLV